MSEKKVNPNAAAGRRFPVVVPLLLHAVGWLVLLLWPFRFVPGIVGMLENMEVRFPRPIRPIVSLRLAAPKAFGLRGSTSNQAAAC